MARLDSVYRGKTWRLKKALRLLDKEKLDPGEAESLLDCVRFLADHAVGLMTEKRQEGDAASVLDALARTSEMLLKRASLEINGSAEMEGVKEKLESAEREVWFLAERAGRLGTGQSIYLDA